MKKTITWISSILISSGIGYGLCLLLNSQFGRETLQETLACIFGIVSFLYIRIFKLTEKGLFDDILTACVVVGGPLGFLVGYLITKPGIGHLVVTIIFACIGCFIAHNITNPRKKTVEEETEDFINEMKEKYDI